MNSRPRDNADFHPARKVWKLFVTPLQTFDEDLCQSHERVVASDIVPRLCHWLAHQVGSEYKRGNI